MTNASNVGRQGSLRVPECSMVTKTPPAASSPPLKAWVGTHTFPNEIAKLRLRKAAKRCVEQRRSSFKPRRSIHILEDYAASSSSIQPGGTLFQILVSEVWQSTDHGRCIPEPVITSIGFQLSPNHSLGTRLNTVAPEDVRHPLQGFFC